MSKFTVWMSGDGDLTSFNPQPRKYDKIEAEDFIGACRYVYTFYHWDWEGHWVMEFDNGTPFFRNIHRNWRYGLYPTEQEAYDATFGKIEAQKIAAYRRMKHIPEGEPINLKCWEKFAIPHIEDAGENINISYVCYPMRRQILFYEPKSSQECAVPMSYVPFGILDSCVNCPKRNCAGDQSHE